MKSEHLAYIVIGLTCLFFIATCDECEDNEKDSYPYSVI